MTAAGSSSLRISRLAGGLRVVTESLPDAASVALGVWVGVGSRDEPAPVAGVSHFLEHLLFKGAPGLSARAIAEGVDARGGDLNAFTSREYTAFHARLPAAELAWGLDVLLSVIREPAFADRDVEAERHVILEELAWSADTPDDLVHTALAESLYPDHPLGREVLGTARSVRAVTPEDIRAFHRRWYRRANLVVAAAGPVDHDAVVDRVENVLGDLDPGERPRRTPPGTEIRRLHALDRPIEQTHVAIGWRALSLDHDDRFALAVANQVLGGGWSSRLFQEIREKRGMAYSVYSSLAAHHDAGSLSVYAGTNPDQVASLLAIVRDEIDELTGEGPSAREVEVARGGFEGATILALEDTGNRMSRLATGLTVRDRVIPVEEYLERVRAVTVEDVRRVLAEVAAGHRALALVGPDVSARVHAVAT